MRRCPESLDIGTYGRHNCTRPQGHGGKHLVGSPVDGTDLYWPDPWRASPENVECRTCRGRTYLWIGDGKERRHVECPDCQPPENVEGTT